MLAQGQDNGLTIHCQVEPIPNGVVKFYASYFA